MRKLDSFVNNSSDRDRIIVKELPDRKSQDDTFNNGKSSKGVPRSYRLKSSVKFFPRSKDTSKDLPTICRWPFRGYLLVLFGYFS
tara:strand:+ start:887 stop:1141 length:255 start_codon:yes stop_codon:yes gene_type:complete